MLGKRGFNGTVLFCSAGSRVTCATAWSWSESFYSAIKGRLLAKVRCDLLLELTSMPILTGPRH